MKLTTTLSLLLFFSMTTFAQNVPFIIPKTKKNDNCTQAQPNRSFDGSCNNMNQNQWGQAIQPFANKMMPAYGPNGAMSGQNRPSSRIISNQICHQNAGENVASQRGLSSMVYTFFQFIDHNITATAEGHTEFAPISVPANDPFFDPNGTGTQIIPFMRTMKMTDANGNPSPVNMLSSWIDAAGIYGADETRANWLRTFQNGKLKTSQNNLLPCNTVTGNCSDAIDTLAPFMAGNKNHCGDFQKIYVAGDVRANEQPGLLSLHTMFVREHNYICDALISQGMTDDEKIYQKARRIVAAEIQSIVYDELLPALGVHLGNYRGYDHQMQPDIYNVFSTAAFRLGHTMVAEELILVDNNCQPISGSTGCGALDGDCSCSNTNVNFNGTIGIKEAFFHPSLVENIGIEPILKGITAQTQQEIDAKVISGLRNFLFGAPGSGGLDLAALNIQRGRDHGLPDYNAIRQHFTGTAASTFADITSDPAMQTALAATYSNINDIDAFVGLIAEDHLPNTSIGATIHAILKDQFTRLRECDRYFYKIDPMLTPDERLQIENTSLADILTRNTTLNNLTTNAFYARNCSENNDIQLIAGETTGYSNQIIEVPITVENFNNVYQITANFQWDASQLEFQHVSTFNISDGNAMTTNTPNSLHLDWSNFQNTGNTLANGDALMALKFKIIGNAEANVAIELNPTFAASVGGTAPTYQVNAASRKGNVHIQTLPNHFKISGMVATPNGFPAHDLEVNFIKNGGLQSYYYINEGQTTFEKAIVSAGTDYEFWVRSVAVNCPFAHRLSVLDAVLLQAHLQNTRSFDVPNSHLAADSDENNFIGQVDSDNLKNILLRKANHFPTDNYRFFSTERYPTLAAPFDIIQKRNEQNIQNFLYGQNFMGVPKGKIVESEDFKIIEEPTSYEPILNEKTVIKNEVIEIPIFAHDLGEILGLQLTLNWDKDVLEYLDIASPSLTNFSTADLDIQDLGNGQIGIVWHSSDGNSINVAENDTLFKLTFNVIGNRGDYSFINITNDIKPIMVVTDDYKIKRPNFDRQLLTVIENFEGIGNPFNVNLYPNPASDYINLQFQLDAPTQNVNIQIFNAVGKSVYQFQEEYSAGLHLKNIQDLDLATGNYFVIFEIDGERVLLKFIVRK